MENKCLHCGKKVKNKYCNVSCQNRHQKKGVKIKKESIEKRTQTELKKWKEFKVTCHTCNTPFTVKEYDVKKPKKEKYFCCRSCSNVRVWTEENRKKLSETAKKSEKVKRANKIIAENNKGFKTINGVKITAMTMIDTPCSYCGEPITHKENVVRTHHKECWLKCSGGIRKGSSRGKSGTYMGYHCDSSYELAWVIYQLEHNSPFQRNKEGFNYVYSGVNHTYYPDFILPDKSYVEIKNFKSELTDAKIKYFPHKIVVLYKEEIKEKILPYVISKHGKNFTDLYE
jgi:hypothetical protein